MPMQIVSRTVGAWAYSVGTLSAQTCILWQRKPLPRAAVVLRQRRCRLGRVAMCVGRPVMTTIRQRSAKWAAPIRVSTGQVVVKHSRIITSTLVKQGREKCAQEQARRHLSAESSSFRPSQVFAGLRRLLGLIGGGLLVVYRKIHGRRTSLQWLAADCGAGL